MPRVMSRKHTLCQVLQATGEKQHACAQRKRTQPSFQVHLVPPKPPTSLHTCTHVHTHAHLWQCKCPLTNSIWHRLRLLWRGGEWKGEGGISWGSIWLPAGPEDCRFIGMQRWCTEGGRTGVEWHKKPQSSWHGCGAVGEYQGESLGTVYPPELCVLRLTWPHFF